MEKTNTNVEISRLLEYGLQRGLIAPEDKAYAANRMLALLGLREFEPQPVEEELHTPVEPLERLCQFAAEAGLIEPDTRDGRDQFDTELMNCLMPRPSQVVGEFYSLYEKDKQAATDYYYQLARSSNDIRVDRIEKDRMWTAPTPVSYTHLGQGGLLGEELRHGDAQGLADALQGGHRGHVVAQKQVGQGGLGHTGLLGQAVDAPAPLLQQCSNAFQAVHSVASSLPFFTRLHYIGDRKH